MRGAIREFVEATTHIRVCGEAGDGLTAIQKARECGCSLVLLDIGMQHPNGVETASALRKELPHVKLVGFSMLAAELGRELVATKTFDVVISKFGGLTKLVDTLKSLMPAPSTE